MVGSDMWIFEISGSVVTATDYKAFSQVYPTKDTSQGGTNDIELLGWY